MAKQNWKAKGQTPQRRERRWESRTTVPDGTERVKLSPVSIFSSLALLLLVFLLVVLIRWLDPVTPPRLLVVTTRNASRNVPVHATATTDARVLAHQAVLDASQAMVSPLRMEEFEASVRGIRNHRPRQLTLLPWRATTTIVYINATGVAVPDPGTDTISAWFLPSDFNPHREIEGQLVSFRNVVNAFVNSKANRRLLVLDCQVAEANPLFAESADRFVEAAVDELNAMPATQRDGLFVLFSCAEGQHSWPWPSRTESIFGHYFSAGLSGDADIVGNSDERVSLGELTAFLQQNVSEQAGLLCDGRQTPLLLDFGQPIDRVTLTATAEGRGFQRPVAPVQSTTRSLVLGSLEQNWTRYFELSQRTPPPVELTPARWRRIQDSLLLAESQIRGNELDPAAATLRDVEHTIESLLETHRIVNELTRPSTLTMLGVDSAFQASPWAQPQEPAAGGSDPPADDESGGGSDDILGDLLDEKIDITQALERIEDHASSAVDPIDCDQQLFRLMTQPRDGLAPASVGEAERRLLQNRRLAEIASLPGHHGSGPWVRPRIQTADLARRRQEDHYLLAGAAPVAVGPEQTATTDDANAQYQGVIHMEQTLTHALRLRDQLLSELPYWIQFLRSSAHHGDDNNTPDISEPEDSPSDTDTDTDTDTDAVTDEEPAATPSSTERTDMVVLAEELVPILVTDTETLCQLLLQDPEELTHEQSDAEVRRIRQAADGVARLRDRLVRRLFEYASDLNDDRLWPVTGRRWRRIDSLLKMPFACGTPRSDSEESALESARLRLALIEKTLVAAADSDSSALRSVEASAEEAAAEEDRLRKLSVLSAQLISIPLDDMTVPSVEASPATWRSWIQEREQKLRDLTDQTNTLSWRDAMRADVAYRLERDAGVAGHVLSPTMSLQSRSFSGHLLFQAVRAVEDFYASVDPGQPDYYDRMASRFRDSAVRMQNAERFLARITDDDSVAEDINQASKTRIDGVAPASMISDQLRELDELQQRYRKALDAARVTAEPAELMYRATTSSPLRLRVFQAEDLPGGTAAVHVSPGSRVQSTGTADGRTFAEFQVTRPPESSDNVPTLEAIASFRGHTFRTPVSDVIIDELKGDSFVYQQQNTGPGRLFLQTRRLSDQPLQLMFVLDCSKSMSFEDGQGTPRIHSLTRNLRRFSAFAQAGSIEVGIRLFGHRVPDIDDPAARTDTERVMKVGPFAQARLDRLLPLTPTGHSPVFEALLQARQDFPESEDDVRREIILISDGADNWAQAGELPGLPELQQAFSDTSIRINTIGYNVTRFADREQLQAIAAVTGGKAVAAADAEALFRELVGLAGLPGFRVIQNEQVIVESDRLEIAMPAIELDPGNYAVEIRGAENDIITSRAIRVLPGEEHRLEYDSGSLEYVSDPRRTALAVAGGEAGQPDLVVLGARRADSGMELEFGLLPQQGTRELMLPVSAQITAPGPDGLSWQLQGIPPNQGQYHFPTWNVRVENWPDGAQQLGLAVRWNQSIDTSIPVTLDWDSPQREVTVAPGIKLVRQVRRVDAEGSGPPEITLTFVFDEAGPSVQQWSVVPRTPIASVRHVYQADVGVYSVQLSLQNGTTPRSVDLIRLHQDPTNPVLNTEVSLGTEKINR